MKILVPVDTSECSRRALEHAVELATAVDGTVDVVHFTEFEDEQVEGLRESVDEVMAESGVEGSTAIVGDIRLGSLRASTRIGNDILKYATSGEYDQIVMGHHGSGAVGDLLLGSAAETVVEDTEIPVTVVP
jgi:nucleotide-binding universal stress UspA family protein